MTGEEVPYESIVKGYEIAPDRYVIVEPDELEALDPQKTQDDRHPRLRRARGHRPDLLRPPVLPRARRGRLEALQAAARGDEETGKVGIATVVIRNKQAVVAVRPSGDALQMATLVYADEVVPADRLDELPEDEVELNDRELAIAKQLVESLATEWEPQRYKDEYREKVLAMVEAQGRRRGGRRPARAAEEAAPVPDLMAALKASLDAVKDRDGRRRRAGQAEKEAAQPGARRRRRRGKACGHPCPRAHHRSVSVAPTSQAPASAAGAAARASSTSTRTGRSATTPRSSAGSTSSSSRRRGRRCGSARIPAATSRRPGSTPAAASSTCTTRSGAPGATRRSSTTWSASPARCRTCAARWSPTSTARSLPREKVLACAVRLLDKGFFRIGSEDYAVTNETFGLATMRKEHVELLGDGILLFDYPAKHGKRRVQSVVDDDVYDIVCRLKRRRAGGDELLAFKRGRSWVDVRSPDINAVPQGPHRPRGQRQGLPHVERDRAGRGRAERLGPAGQRLEDRAQAGDHARDQGGRPLPRQHARRRARLLHRPAHPRPLRGRHHDRPRHRRDSPTPAPSPRSRARSRRRCSTSSPTTTTPTA